MNVVSKDKDGDGLAGRQDPDLFPMDDKARQTHAVFALSTSQQRLVLMPEVLAAGGRSVWTQLSERCR